MNKSSAKIYLVGFMGVGKTTIGKLLARQLNRQFLDTDDVFAELNNGMTTGEYIRTYGLDIFRPQEKAALHYLADRDLSAVIATGGGVPVYDDNMQTMKNSGLVIHLFVPLAIITSRMSPAELAKRPLWSEKSPQELQEFFNGRLAIYNQADYTIQADKSPELILQDIISILNA